MSKLTSVKIAGLAVLVSAIGVLPAATSAGASQPQPEQATTGTLTAATSQGDIMARTELFFGRNCPPSQAKCPANGEVTEGQFEQFLEVEVTKRFPDGLTLLSGLGQFKDADKIIKEQSKLLILLYPLKDRDAGKRINEIREAYKKEFAQQSVLRTDSLQRVSF